MEKMVEEIINCYSCMFFRDKAKRKIFIFLIITSIFLFIHLDTPGDTFFYKLCAFSISLTIVFYVFSLFYDILIYFMTRSHIQFPNNNAISRLPDDDIWALIKANPMVHEKVIKKIKSNEKLVKLEEKRYKEVCKLNLRILFNRYIHAYNESKMMLGISIIMNKNYDSVKKYFEDLKRSIAKIELIKRAYGFLSP